MNPHFANIVSPTEIVVVTRFNIELDGGGGELHLTMPYAMIEPLREMLDSGVQSDRVEHDAAGCMRLREEIEDAEVALTTRIARSHVTLEQLVNLKPGDIIPCDFDGKVTVYAEDVPIMRGTFGVSHGQQAVKIEQRVRRLANDHPRPSLRNDMNATSTPRRCAGRAEFDNARRDAGSGCAPSVPT